jgi:arginine-tRNA-protein transferase
MLYRTQCPVCNACEPLRIPVDRFQPSASQRRVWRRNEGKLTVDVGTPELSWERLQMYNRHKQDRGLAQDQASLNAYGYRTWLVESCADTRELRYSLDGRLIAISILDFGRTSVSSVYHYFDPEHARLSVGVYSVLKELELARTWGYRWYYLGFFVKDCSRLNYKATYFPHQRKADGAWREFA